MSYTKKCPGEKLEITTHETKEIRHSALQISNNKVRNRSQNNRPIFSVNKPPHFTQLIMLYNKRVQFLNSRFFVISGSFPPVIVFIRRFINHGYNFFGQPSVFNQPSVPLLPVFHRFVWFHDCSPARQNSPSFLFQYMKILNKSQNIQLYIKQDFSHQNEISDVEIW